MFGKKRIKDLETIIQRKDGRIRELARRVDKLNEENISHREKIARFEKLHDVERETQRLLSDENVRKDIVIMNMAMEIARLKGKSDEDFETVSSIEKEYKEGASKYVKKEE